MALANAEFVHLPARELLLEQPQIVLLTSENLKHSAYSKYSHRGHEAWEQLAVSFGASIKKILKNRRQYSWPSSAFFPRFPGNRTPL
jgi:hypothetical protein